jgi:NitT/TauT family transport system permease protein
VSKLVGTPIGSARRLVLGLIPIAILAILYAWASYARHVENPLDRLLPGLNQLIQGLREITTPDKRSGEVWLWVDTRASLVRLGEGFGLGVAIAVIIGTLTGIFSHVRGLLQPLTIALAKIPPLALLPIVFIFLGVDESSKIALIAIGVAPTLANDIGLAAAAVPREMIVKAYTLGATTTEVVVKVILPQVMPRILDSIRLTVGPAWIFLIAAEAISADSGLGYRIYVVQRQLAMNIILPYVLWIALLGVCMDLGLNLLSRWLYPWAKERS